MLENFHPIQELRYSFHLKPYGSNVPFVAFLYVYIYIYSVYIIYTINLNI